MVKTSLIAKLTTQPGKRDALVEAFGPMMEAVNSEAGTELYILCTDDGNDDVAWVFELYTDAAAVESHLGSDAMAAMLGSVGGLLAAPPQLDTVTPVRAKGVAI